MIKNVVIVYDYAFIEGGAASVAIDTALRLAEKSINVYFFAGSGRHNAKASGYF
ncbi:MAG: hypothetical protein IJG65_06245 [Synergistaceae bacterium]|nr:hypothetical protein [Synergistaceae bacterium]